MKILNIKLPNERSPSVIIHIYYLMIAITFTYLYYHKFIQGADFYNPVSPGGIFAVANFESVKPLQFRILIPLIFKGLSMLHIVPPKLLFFFINTGLAYLILVSFYFLLGRYFKSKAMNCWLSPIIIYPMIWNLVIMNGQFFYMDFALLLSMIIGFYCIVAKKPNWLLFTFFIGLLNHSGVVYLIMSYLLFNYKELFRIKTIIYSTSLVVIFFGVIAVLNLLLPNDAGGTMLVNNSMRNFSLLWEHPPHLLLRDLFFNFGGLHFIVLLFLVKGLWKRFKGPLLYVNLMIIPFLISMFFTFSIEEMRNYAVIIPNVVLLSLMFLSTFDNNFLRPIDTEGNEISVGRHDRQ